MRWILVPLLAATLTACATTQPPEPIVRPVQISVPVPTPCVSDATPQAPVYPDTDDTLRAATPGQRYVLMARGRLMRIQRLMETEPVILACRK